jgi:hypothetical protein
MSDDEGDEAGPNECPNEGTDHLLINGKADAESCRDATSHQSGGLDPWPAPCVKP